MDLGTTARLSKVATLSWSAAGRVTPMIETFDKEQVADAVAKVAAGDVRFRAVVEY